MKSITSLLAIIITAIFLTACSTSNNSTSEPLVMNYEEAKVVGNLAIAPQPTKMTLSKIKKDGYEMVINLRGEDEFKGYNEEATAKMLNLQYHRIPFFNKKSEIDANSLYQISKLIDANKDKKIYIHCSSGNRAAAWYLTHLYQYEGMTKQEATELARRTGLTKAPLENKVLKYLNEK
ncbi:sulfur transferase domain-containing protein [Halobacteriovorax sp. XZX-3]|uniref:beta-lactamase hydrolase domain-containing protein n=1 Tax=unclassified Halobacteriovorax TaxID=2639665 RepID=UPI000CD0E52D|nr:sulfur transferase domain-containing protein [Halobacteriovorax sp. DA5]POB14124.1 hypothetical protein C0Z22_08675 [Halobacteriovorax sp. DA5]